MEKALKLMILICLIVLAGVGIGISSGVPIPMTKNRRNSEKQNIELIDDESKTSDTTFSIAKK